MKLVRETTSKLVFEDTGSTSSGVFGLILSFFFSWAIFTVVYQAGFTMRLIQVLPVIAMFILFLLASINILDSSVESKNWIFDKSSQIFTHEKARPFHETKTLFSISLTNFKELQIIKNGPFGSEDVTSYDLTVLFKSSAKYELFSSSDLSEVQKIAMKLSDFLQLPINKVRY